MVGYKGTGFPEERRTASDGGSQAERRTTASEDRTYSAAGGCRSVVSDHASLDEDHDRFGDKDQGIAAAAGVVPSWGDIAARRSSWTVKAVGLVKSQQIRGNRRKRYCWYSHGSGAG